MNDLIQAIKFMTANFPNHNYDRIDISDNGNNIWFIRKEDKRYIMFDVHYEEDMQSGSCPD